jgi:hypothetical protein
MIRKGEIPTSLRIPLANRGYHPLFIVEDKTFYDRRQKKIADKKTDATWVGILKAPGLTH